MSAYTTLRITRGKALEIMIRRIAGAPTNEKLETFLRHELEDRLLDVRIVSDDEENDDACI